MNIIVLIFMLYSAVICASDIEYKCFTELSFDSRVTIDDNKIADEFCYDHQRDRLTEAKIRCMYQLLANTSYAQDDFYDEQKLIMQGDELIHLLCRDARPKFKQVRKDVERLRCLVFYNKFIVKGEHKKLPAAFRECSQKNLSSFKCRSTIAQQYDFFIIDYPLPNNIKSFKSNLAIDEFCKMYPRGYKKLLQGDKKFRRIFFQLGSDKVITDKALPLDNAIIKKSLLQRVTNSIEKMEEIIWHKLSSLGPYGKSYCSP